MKQFWKIVFSSFILFNCLIENSEACKCGPVGSVTEEFVKNDAVFSGRITKMEVGKKNYQNTITFIVSKFWKGKEYGETIEVDTPYDIAACGINFSKNKEYIIYAYNLTNSNTLNTDSCTRTKLYNSVEASALNPLSKLQMESFLNYLEN